MVDNERMGAKQECFLANSLLVIKVRVYKKSVTEGNYFSVTLGYVTVALSALYIVRGYFSPRRLRMT